MTSQNTLALLVDVGGTNTRLALAKGADVIASSISRHRNAGFDDLYAVLRHYLAQQDAAPTQVGIAVAGPVEDGVARLTNLEWSIDQHGAKEATGAQTVSILNDLQAQGHAVGALASGDIEQIIGGAPIDETAAKLVVGIGTGFNTALVLDTKPHRIVHAAESGHMALPVDSPRDLALADYIKAEKTFAALEDALSGRGVETLYRWVSGGEVQDAAKVLESAKDQSDPHAVTAAEVFCRLLGMSVGNLALSCLPTGGIYLVGGVSRAFSSLLPSMQFIEAFQSKGRFSEFMQQFSVFVVQDDYAALTGLAHHIAANSEENSR